MKDHQIAQLVNRVFNDVRLNIPDLPQCLRGIISGSVTGFYREMQDQPPMTRIVCAAIRAADGSVLSGIRHYSPDMHAAIDKRSDGSKFLRCGGDDQGFVDQHGQYYTRQEAWDIADAAGQIVRRVGGDQSAGGTLYSENLY